MSATSYEPFEVQTRDRLVGIFVIIGLLLFLAGYLVPLIASMTREQGITLYTELPETYGIAPDAKVSLRGVAIGRVSDVAITDAGTIRIDLLLDREYEDFYRLGSKLTLNTNLGVSTLLTGTGLILDPGPKGADQLPPGSQIATIPPAQLNDLMDKLSDPALVDNIFSIVANVEAITAGLAANQATLYAGLDDLKTTTGHIALATQRLPEILSAAERSLQQLELTISGMARQVQDQDSSLQKTLGSTADLTAEANLAVGELRLLIKASQGLTRQLPVFLATTNTTLLSISQLSDQMSQSWLFGGDEEAGGHPAPSRAYLSHPHDDSLYSGPERTDQRQRR